MFGQLKIRQQTLLYMRRVMTIGMMLVLAGCNESPRQEAKKAASSLADLTVFKRKDCGCCNDWIRHLESSGYKVVKEDVEDLNSIKEKFGIAPRLSSCHTSINQAGYIFEGHIPAKFIRQFLKEKPPGARGLAVPAMPTGSPGMEFGEMFMPYKIYLLREDGELEIYAEINHYEEQF